MDKIRSGEDTTFYFNENDLRKYLNHINDEVAKQIRLIEKDYQKIVKAQADLEDIIPKAPKAGMSTLLMAENSYKEIQNIPDIYTASLSTCYPQIYFLALKAVPLCIFYYYVSNIPESFISVNPFKEDGIDGLVDQMNTIIGEQFTKYNFKFKTIKRLILLDFIKQFLQMKEDYIEEQISTNLAVQLTPKIKEYAVKITTDEDKGTLKRIENSNCYYITSDTLGLKDEQCQIAASFMINETDNDFEEAENFFKDKFSVYDRNKGRNDISNSKSVAFVGMVKVTVSVDKNLMTVIAFGGNMKDGNLQTSSQGGVTHLEKVGIDKIIQGIEEFKREIPKDKLGKNEIEILLINFVVWGYKGNNTIANTNMCEEACYPYYKAFAKKLNNPSLIPSIRFKKMY